MSYEFRFDDVTSELARRHGLHSYVEQTGGGCATIYVGPWKTDDEGCRRYTVVAGPGWFHGPNWSDGRGTTEDFYVSGDHEGITDEFDYWQPSDDDDATSIADAIAAVWMSEVSP